MLTKCQKETLNCHGYVGVLSFPILIHKSRVKASGSPGFTYFAKIATSGLRSFNSRDGGKVVSEIQESWVWTHLAPEFLSYYLICCVPFKQAPRKRAIVISCVWNTYHWKFLMSNLTAIYLLGSVCCQQIHQSWIWLWVLICTLW